jgi:hypothetical protein
VDECLPNHGADTQLIGKKAAISIGDHGRDRYFRLPI